MKIVGLQKVSLIDFPERIAATVFIGGCNLDCGYCHNRWMIDAGAIEPIMAPADLLAWLATRQGKLDGVCFTGGEPCGDPDLADLIRAVRALGLAIKLDTNGVFPDCLQRLLDDALLDYVAMDVKAPLDARYADTVRVPIPLERLLRSLQRSMTLLRQSALPHEFRTTVHPLLDGQALHDLARQLEPGDTWVLQPFEPTPEVLPEIRALPALSAAELEAFLPALREIIPGVTLRAL
jgi:pyruvate formate lyase activating enzyme